MPSDNSDEDISPELLDRLYTEVRRRQRRTQISIVSALVVITFALIFWASRIGVEVPNIFLPIIASTLGIAILGAVLLYYLQGIRRERLTDETEFSYDSTQTSAAINKLSQRLLEIETEIGLSNDDTRTYVGALSEEDRRHLVNELYARLRNTASEQLVAELQNRVERDHAVREVRRRGNATTQRLRQEVLDLARRGNLNLVLGILTTLVGLCLLTWIVFTTPLDEIGPAAAIAHYLPRITLVVLIEVFAYFFLSLYRRSLTDIKYFQNELTSIEQKLLALNVSDELDQTDALQSILVGIAETDRNSAPADTTVRNRPQTDSGISATDVLSIIRILKEKP